MGFEIIDEVFGFGVVKRDLAEDGESGAHAALIGGIFKIEIGFIDDITHFVSKGDEVELAIVESLVDDRIVVVTINIVFIRNEGNFVGFHDKFVCSANIFVEFT